MTDTIESARRTGMSCAPAAALTHCWDLGIGARVRARAQARAQGAR